MSKGVMTVMKGQKLAGNIYKLLGTTIIGGVATAKSELDSTFLWHMRLGYISECGMMELYKRNLLKGIKTCKLDFCKYCVFGKQNKVQFKIATRKTKGVLDYVHTDVWGPVRVASLGGSKYFVSLINSYLSLTKLKYKKYPYVLKHKTMYFLFLFLFFISFFVIILTFFFFSFSIKFFPFSFLKSQTSSFFCSSCFSFLLFIFLLFFFWGGGGRRGVHVLIPFLHSFFPPFFHPLIPYH